jgi:hypothetical protein
MRGLSFLKILSKYLGAPIGDCIRTSSNIQNYYTTHLNILLFPSWDVSIITHLVIKVKPRDLSVSGVLRIKLDLFQIPGLPVS